MKISIVGRQLNVYEDTKNLIESKLSKLDKYFRAEMEPQATVTLSRKRNVSSVEVTVNAGGTLFRSEVDSDDFRSAMDKTVDNIERQIRKNKTRLAKRLREGFVEPASEIEARPGDEGQRRRVEHLERKIRMTKICVATRFGEGFLEPASGIELTPEDDGQILRVKRFVLRPMSAEDAIMQMNLLGHDFFVFSDIDSGKTCVVYVRKDGTYGLIEPENA